MRVGRTGNTGWDGIESSSTVAYCVNPGCEMKMIMMIVEQVVG
jgi:hypothetical protein